MDLNTVRKEYDAGKIEVGVDRVEVVQFVRNAYLPLHGLRILETSAHLLLLAALALSIYCFGWGSILALPFLIVFWFLTYSSYLVVNSFPFLSSWMLALGGVLYFEPLDFRSCVLILFVSSMMLQKLHVRKAVNFVRTSVIDGTLPGFMFNAQVREPNSDKAS